MRSRKRSAHESFHVNIKKPKHISSFNMDPTDNVIQLGWNFLSQNKTRAVSMHPTKRLIAVLTEQNCFKIFTFDGYFVTLVNRFPKGYISIVSSISIPCSILLLEDIIITYSFQVITIYTDNEIEHIYAFPLNKLSYYDHFETILKNSDENRYFYQKQIHESNPVHIFIPDQTSFDEIQLFSIKQDTMIVIPRAEICDKVYRIYRMSISDGKILAKYSIDKLPTVEGYPHCVSIDSRMHVYILTPSSDVIHFLSPEGRTADIQVLEINFNRYLIIKKFKEMDTFLNSLFMKLGKISAPFCCNFEKILNPAPRVPVFNALPPTVHHPCNISN